MGKGSSTHCTHYTSLWGPFIVAMTLTCSPAGFMLCLVTWWADSSMWLRWRTRRLMPTTAPMLTSGSATVGNSCWWEVRMLNSTPTHVNYMYVHWFIYWIAIWLLLSLMMCTYMYMYIVHVYNVSVVIELKMLHYSWSYYSNYVNIINNLSYYSNTKIAYC